MRDFLPVFFQLVFIATKIDFVGFIKYSFDWVVMHIIINMKRHIFHVKR